MSDQSVVPDVTAIVHPLGYDGTSGVLQISVCMEEGTAHQDVALGPLQRAVTAWNNLQSTTGGYIPPGTSSEVPPNVLDFETVLLHELGHSVVALGHPNIRQKLPFPASQAYRNATNSTSGINGDYDFDFIGLDNRWGSSDDLRGDDISVHWFRKDLNDPYLTPPPPVIDSTTYGILLSQLPGSHTYSANANWELSTLLGYGDTEAVMHFGFGVQAESRALTADDVNTVRYAMSGLNELAGDADDYSVNLLASTDPCDVPIAFTFDQQVVSTELLALSRIQVSGPLGSTTNHFVINSARIDFNDHSVRWYFTPGPNLRVTKTDGNEASQAGETLTYVIDVFNIGGESLTGITLSDVVPDNTTFEPTVSDPGWDCSGTVPGSTCTLNVGLLGSGGSEDYDFAVTIDNPLAQGVGQISNTVNITDDGASGPDIDPSDNSATDTNTIPSIFADGFETGDTSAWSGSVP